MGDIDRVIGDHLVQLENRQLKTEKLKIKMWLFYLFLLLGDMAKLDQFSIVYDFN